MIVKPNEAKEWNRNCTLLPPIPLSSSLFQRGYSYHSANVIHWEWSTTFGKWGALVEFHSDNERTFTWPKPS
jgi:hypothetical protein